MARLPDPKLVEVRVASTETINDLKERKKIFYSCIGEAIRRANSKKERVIK